MLTYFLQYLTPRSSRLGLAGACLLGSILMHLARPWPLKVVFDYVLLPTRDPSARWSILEGLTSTTILVGASLSVVLFALLKVLFDYLHVTTAAKVGQKMIFQVRSHLYNHIQRLSLGFHDRNKSGDLVSRLVKEVNQLRDFLTDSALQLAGEMLFVVGMILVMLAIDWKMTLLSLSLLPLLLLSISHYSGRVRTFTRKRLKREGEVASLFTEALASIREVQIFGSGDEESDRFHRENRKSYKAEMRSLRSKAKLLGLVEGFSAFGLCLVLGWGAVKVMDGRLTPGDLLVFITYLKSMFKPIRRIASLSVQASKAWVAAERVVEIINTEPEVQDAPDAIEAPRFCGALEFVNVSHAYEPGVPVLEDISFWVLPGQTVAILGASGTGKTTLVSLVPRLYDPTAGEIRIDGYDIRRLKLASLRDQITVVPQNPALFGATIRENIAVGNPAADDAAIRRAAKLANAHEFIDRLPGKYDAVLGERGATLSGGQRQRIAIARALLREAPIVILDEPLTGLDPMSEEQVLAGFDNLLTGRTALIIAHRLSTVLRADCIIVLEDGRIAEMGDPRTLLNARGYLYRLAQVEFGPLEIQRALGTGTTGVRR